MTAYALDLYFAKSSVTMVFIMKDTQVTIVHLGPFY